MNVKFRDIPRRKDEFRGKFRDSIPRKNPNSAARLEIPRAAETVGPTDK